MSRLDPDVASYFDAVPENRRERVESLHRIITELYPDIAISMQYRMPTYRHGDGWVALANQKHYVSLYTCAASHLESFRQRHPELRTGKGCINFRARDEVPAAAVREVVRHAIEHPK